MKTLRYGMIGCGMMGREHIRNIKLLPDVQLPAIYEPDAAMRSAAKALAPEAEFVPSLEALLAVNELDALVIASPNHKHIDQLEAIRALRPLPVLVEKPLATSPEQRERVHALLQTYPAPIWVAMEYRYMPPVAALIAEVQEVTGGVTMLSIREHRFPFLPKVGDWNRFNANTGGTFVEKCCHFFDLMRLILASEPVRVFASAGQAHNHLGETYGGKTPDIWDHGYVILDFENGARAMLELCMFADGEAYQEEISAVGPRGKIACLVPGPVRFWRANRGAPPEPKLIISPREPSGHVTKTVPVDPNLLSAGDHNGSTFYQHQKFRKAVLGLAKPEVTLIDGWKAVAVGMAAQRSALSGEAVLMADFE